MRQHFNFFILLLSFGFVINSFSQKPDWKLASDSIQVEGIYRTFEYFVPKQIKKNPSLLFFMHGSGGTPTRIRMGSNYEFEKIADQRKNFIIVYPLGYQNHWNDCRATASYAANKEDINEIAFFDQMIDYFVGKHQAERKAVFASGASNGGHMCFKLAYEMPEQFKGIAPLIANLPDASNNDCKPKEIPISMMIINGTGDKINPNEGGWVVVRKDSTRGKVVSTQQTMNYWKQLMACDLKVHEISYPDIIKEDQSTVHHTKYSCAHSLKKVELVSVKNGGHNIPLILKPEVSERLIEGIGQMNNDVSSPLLVMDFFESLK